MSQEIPATKRRGGRPRKQRNSSSDAGSEEEAPQVVEEDSEIPVPAQDELELFQPPKQDHNARWYFITINNYTNRYDVINKLSTNLSLVFWIVGFETGEQGTKHCHIVWKPHHPKKWSTVKAQFPEGNVQCGKQFLKAIQYVKKDGDWEMSPDGEKYCKETGKSKRTDLNVIAASIQAHGIGQTALKFPSVAMRLSKGMIFYSEQLGSQIEKPKPEVIWIYGPSGHGKTQWALCEAAAKELGYYVNPGSAQWFDGYEPAEHKMVLLDDVRNTKESWPFSSIIKYTDSIPIKVPVKGGFRNWVPHYIIITSLKHPKHHSMYGGDDNEDYEQVARRIDHLFCMYAEFKYFRANKYEITDQPSTYTVTTTWQPVFKAKKVVPLGLLETKVTAEVVINASCTRGDDDEIITNLPYLELTPSPPAAAMAPPAYGYPPGKKKTVKAGKVIARHLATDTSKKFIARLNEPLPGFVAASQYGEKPWIASQHGTNKFYDFQDDSEVGNVFPILSSDEETESPRKRCDLTPEETD